MARRRGRGCLPRACKPVLSLFWRERVIHAGPPGHGHTLKLINNFIAQAIATATAEACAAAAKSGLSIRKPARR